MEAFSQNVKNCVLTLWSAVKKMKNIHFLFSSYKTTILRNMICWLIK